MQIKTASQAWRCCMIDIPRGREKCTKQELLMHMVDRFATLMMQNGAINANKRVRNTVKDATEWHDTGTLVRGV